VQPTLSLFALGDDGGQPVCSRTVSAAGRCCCWALPSIRSRDLPARSPIIELLLSARLVQGLGGCAGPIVCRAIVRDH